MKPSVSSLVYHAKLDCGRSRVLSFRRLCSAWHRAWTPTIPGWTDVKFYPQGPATLTHDQYVRLPLLLLDDAPGRVRIWARP
jgi:hypothetical protein